MNEVIDFLKNDLLAGSRRKKIKFMYILLNKGNLNALLYTKLYLIFSSSKNKMYRILSIYLKNKLIKNYGIEISADTKIGKNFRFGHANGIIIGEGVVIKDNVTMYQQVTVGLTSVNDKGNKKKYPTINDNCILYAGAKILGNIDLAEGTVIGANAVVLKDTEKYGCYVGVPAKKIEKLISNEKN